MKEFRVFYAIIVAVALFVSVFYQSRVMPVVILAMIIVPVYTLILLFFGRRCISVTARFQGIEHNGGDTISVTRGEELTVVITIKNTFILPRAPMRIYGKFYGGRGVENRCLLVNVGARSTVTIRISHKMDMRGQYKVGPVYAEIYDMLKLFRLRKNIPAAFETVTVLPRERSTEDIERVLRESDRYSETHAGTSRRSEIIPQTRRLSGEYTDFREYREGDSPKMIHWKMSAKSDVLLTRISERSIETGDAVVLCDFRTSPQTSPAEKIKITDTAIESALYFIKSLVGEERECLVYTVNGTGEGFHVRHTSDYDELRRRFACIPLRGESDRGEYESGGMENITRRLISDGLADRFTLAVCCTPADTVCPALTGLHNCELVSVTESAVNGEKIGDN